MPAPFAEWGKKWQALHPEWEVTDWRSTAELPPLVNQRLFDRAQELAPKDWKRFQADLLRLELLYLYGGVYVDTDVEPLRPFDRLLYAEAFIGQSPHPDVNGRTILTQAVMGARPGHGWVKACIDQLPGSFRRYARRRLAVSVGPHHVTRVWRGWDGDSVLVHPARYFHPQDNGDRDEGRDPDLEGAYCWHHWSTTWQKQGRSLDELPRAEA